MENEKCEKCGGKGEHHDGSKCKRCRGMSVVSRIRRAVRERVLYPIAGRVLDRSLRWYRDQDGWRYHVSAVAHSMIDSTSAIDVRGVVAEVIRDVGLYLSQDSMDVLRLIDEIAKKHSPRGELKMDRPYFVIDLVDDHVSWEARTKREVIGVYVIEGSVPRIVACGPDLPSGKHLRGPMCLNEVMVEGGLDHPHRGHLTRTSLTTLTERQLALLYDNGFLDFERAGCYVELLAARPAPEAARAAAE